MALITAADLGKSFGPDDIFSDISFSIPRRARFGLVGPNGVGKTTLLRILLGLDEPTAGNVLRARGLTTGYLPQEVQSQSLHSVWEECRAVFADLIAMQAEMSRLESLMTDPRETETTLAAYGRLQAEFEHSGGYAFETRIQQTLTGLGFSREDMHRPFNQLSGGERTRAFLAKLLLSNPDLLLLDEPTNHLDISAIEWLESFLKEWDGAALIVSHDRYFLDQVVDTILEMTPALETYHGNYSAYLTQRADRYERRLEEYQSQQEFIEKEEDYIRRNIAGQNTRQAQGRRRRLERMLTEARLTPPRINRKISLRLEPAARSGDLVVRTYGLSVGYADESKPLFAVPDLILRRRECAAIIGPNGAGKTTFLKTLLEKTPPYQGEVELGASLQIGYFAQAHEGLHNDWTLMEEISAYAPQMLPAAVRDYLARFMFTGDDAFRTVVTLSGGERGRLALACLALQGANLLLLDEPTNHLDLPSQEVLQAILRDFSGTILLVSHDRYLIDALATQVWEVQPEEGILRVFEGTYSEYHAARQAEEQAARTQEAGRYKEKRNRARGDSSGLSQSELRRRNQRKAALEAEISSLEAQLEVITRQLENPPADPFRVKRLGDDYNQLHQTLDERLEEWSSLDS